MPFYIDEKLALDWINVSYIEFHIIQTNPFQFGITLKPKLHDFTFRYFLIIRTNSLMRILLLALSN